MDRRKGLLRHPIFLGVRNDKKPRSHHREPSSLQAGTRPVAARAIRRSPATVAAKIDRRRAAGRALPALSARPDRHRGPARPHRARRRRSNGAADTGHRARGQQPRQALLSTDRGHKGQCDAALRPCCAAHPPDARRSSTRAQAVPERRRWRGVLPTEGARSPAGRCAHGSRATKQRRSILASAATGTLLYTVQLGCISVDPLAIAHGIARRSRLCSDRPGLPGPRAGFDRLLAVAGGSSMSRHAGLHRALKSPGRAGYRSFSLFRPALVTTRRYCWLNWWPPGWPTLIRARRRSSAP